MEGRAEALVLWLQEATDSPPISNINEVRTCRLIEQLLAQIEGFYFAPSAGLGEWKQHYNRLRSVYEQVETYLKETLKLVPPSSLSVMNLVEMAKGESEEGLQSLLLLIFIVCIRCPIKQSFIRCIMKLSSGAQMELMQIIQDWQSSEEDKEDDSQLQSFKQEIARLDFHCQSLAQENASLRASLDEDYERITRNEELIDRLQRQNEQLQRDLSERSEQLRLREQNFLDKYAQHNEDLVEDLKKKLLQQQSIYSHQILRLKETIYSLQESLGQAKRQATQILEEQTRKSMLQSRDEHINCITIEKHKMKVNELLSINKEATQKEINIKLENIQLKNHIAELDSKLKKQTEEMRKKENDFMINTEDASKMKIEFFTRVRDSLKRKFLDYKAKENQDGSGGKIAFQDDQ